jgi:hypothetical protein
MVTVGYALAMPFSAKCIYHDKAISIRRSITILAKGIKTIKLIVSVSEKITMQLSVPVSKKNCPWGLRDAHRG